VYRCSACGNVGYERVTDRETESHCSLCGTIVSGEEEMTYVPTEEEARKRAGMLAIKAQTEVPRVVMGVGLRRRVLEIVQDLVSMNRGWPVPLEHVLTDCNDAGITRERAIHFLDVLTSEELITYDDETVTVVI